MTSVAISALVFVCVFGGALLGLALQGLLPARHFSAHSKDLVRLATGLIATMAALVLGLLIASAKTSYDTQSAEFMQVSAKLVLLDRTLGHYGSEATPAREFLRRLVAALLERIGDARSSQPVPFAPTASAEHMYDVLHKLVPQTEAQRTARTEALGITRDISLARWLLFAQQHGSIPMPFLVMLVFWLTMILTGFGLLAPRDGTAATALLICSLSLAGAIFLILELDRPFDGLLRVSIAPLSDALAQLGR
jgi:hypothetical protein